MTEKLQVNGKNVWVTIEPHPERHPGNNAQEFFTAMYGLGEPQSPVEGILFLDKDKRPVKFDSPVAALEYANEQLLTIV